MITRAGPLGIRNKTKVVNAFPIFILIESLPCNFKHVNSSEPHEPLHKIGFKLTNFKEDTEFKWFDQNHPAIQWLENPGLTVQNPFLYFPEP